MLKVIEGIYQKGKIFIPQVIDIKDETQVLIVFSDTAYQMKNQHDALIEIPLESSAQSDKPELEDIDVTVSTKEKYLKELSMQISEQEENSLSVFFSSEPVDIGHTNADMLDSIVCSVKQ